LGAWIGVRMTLAPTARQMSSKTRVNFTVAVPDQESDDRGVAVEGGEKIAACWATHAGGVGGDTRQLHAPGSQLDEEQYVQPLPEHGVHGEEVARQDAGCLLRKNARQVGDAAARRGAGWRPLARRTLAMELAETRQPSRSSSPRRRW
jgi:hypothetical protein